MPQVLRTKKAQKMADVILKKPKSERKDSKDTRKAHGETEFDRQIRTMIKR